MVSIYEQEQRSLNECPLPQQQIPNPLSYVWECDRQIAVLQDQINDLMVRRQEALDYAVKNNIAEDSHCRLETKVRKTRSLDVSKFRDAFPEEYMTACDIERREKEEALNHIGERINITLIDKLVKKPALESSGAVTVKESVSYAVVVK